MSYRYVQFQVESDIDNDFTLLLYYIVIIVWVLSLGC